MAKIELRKERAKNKSLSMRDPSYNKNYNSSSSGGSSSGRTVVEDTGTERPDRTVDDSNDSSSYVRSSSSASSGGGSQVLESEEDIARRLERQADGLIQSTKQVYADQIRDAEVRGQEDLQRSNALAMVSGYQGGTEAVRVERASKDRTATEVTEIQNKQKQEIQGIYNTISQLAREDYRWQQENARSDRAEDREIEATRKKDLLDNLTYLAQSGAVDYEAFKSSKANEQVFNSALKAFDGSEDILRGFFAINRPQETVIDSVWDGGKLYQVYKNPVTGKLTTEMVDLSVAGYNPPRGYNKSVDLGDKIMMIPENFNPETDTPYYIPKGLTPSQQKSGSGSSSYKISTADRDILLGGGYSLDDIDNIQSDIEAGFTFDEILNNTNDERQKTALKQVFGQKDEEEETSLTRENVANLYGINDTDEKSRFNIPFTEIGFDYGETGKAQLDALMNFIEQYKAVGYTDKEILKMLDEEE